MSIALVTVLSLAIMVVGFLAGWLVGGIGTTLNAIALLSMLTMGIGFLIGWLVEWIIDNQYRRMRELGQASGPVAVPVAAASAPPTDISELTNMLRNVLSEREEEVDGLREDLQTKDQKYDELREKFEQYAAAHPDNRIRPKNDVSYTGVGWDFRDYHRCPEFLFTSCLMDLCRGIGFPAGPILL